jgi:membrane protein YdbS with pleckstrin-like domain
MRFIKKKNLQEGEELLYIPQLHWFYTVKHIVLSLPFFLILFVVWYTPDSIKGFAGIESSLMVKMAVRYVFLAACLLVLLVFLWRIFHYLATEYGVTNKRLMLKKGIFRVFTLEIPIDRIESIYCIQGLLGRLFHYGAVYTSGVGGKALLFYKVHRPYALRRKIGEIIERNKIITVVHGDIPRAKPIEKPVPAAEKEPIYRYGTFVRVLPE